MILAKNLAQKTIQIYILCICPNIRDIDNYNEDTFLVVKNIINEIGIPFVDINKEVFKKKNPA